MKNKMCRWKKTKRGYETLCGHIPNIMGRGYLYCPYCGLLLEKDRADYFKRYYKTKLKGKRKNECMG